MPAVCATTYAGTVLSCISDLPNGEVGVPYLETLTSGFPEPQNVDWTLIAGSLPDGLSLASGNSGVVAGTPLTAQSSNFTIQAVWTVYPQNFPSYIGGICTKEFTLTVSDTPPFSCGWWDGIEYVKDPSPHCSPTTNPSDLTGASEFDLSVGATIPDFGCFLFINGTKTYTGPEVVIKIVMDVTAIGSAFGDGFAIISIYDDTNAVYLIDATVSAVGTYTYSATVPASVAGLFGIHIEGVNGVEATFTMTSCESAESGTGWELVPANPMFFYSPVGMSPSGTIIIASNRPITWTLNNNFVKTIWASPPAITLDGVPLTFYEDGINWYLNLATVDTDACVEKVFNISGATLADSTGLGSFQPVPDVT